MSIAACEAGCATYTATRCPTCWHSFCGDHLLTHERTHPEEAQQSEMVRRAAEQAKTEDDPPER